MLTRTAANFLLALMNHNAGSNLETSLTAAEVAKNIDLLPDTVARKDLLAFWATYTPLVGGRPLGAGPTGPMGRSLRWPSWLTEDPTIRTGRGVFTLPKADLVTWMTEFEIDAQAAIEAAAAAEVTKAAKAAERAAKAARRAADREAARQIRLAAKAAKAAAAAAATPAPAPVAAPAVTNEVETAST